MSDKSLQRNVLIIHPKDNVAVATSEIKEGQAIVGENIDNLKAASDIPASHKVAITAISEGSPVIKYGEPIGTAGKPIKPGDWVHTHNITGEK